VTDGKEWPTSQSHLADLPNGNGKLAIPMAEDGVTDGKEWPKSHLHLADLPNGNGKLATCIWQNCQMDSANLPNPFGKFAGPIPFIKSYKQAAAAKESENDKNEKIVNIQPAAAAISQDGEDGELRSSLSRLKAELVFDNVFYALAIEWMAQKRLDGNFPAWLVGFCEQRKPRNLRGMFRKLFFEADIADLYRSSGASPPESPPRETMTCPVCGEIHRTKIYNCPACGFATDRYGDKAEVERQRRINALPGDIRQEYEREIREATFQCLNKIGSGKSGKDQDQWIAIEKKYHILG
jgi:rubrerythrin